HSLGESGEAGLVEPKTILQSRGEAVLTPVGEVELVGGQDARGPALDRGRDRFEAGILRPRGGGRDDARGPAGAFELLGERRRDDRVGHGRESTDAPSAQSSWASCHTSSTSAKCSA